MSAVLSHVSIKKPAPHLAIVPAAPMQELVTEHATIRTATHSKMIRSKLNVRRKGSGDVRELAALIASQGLLQNLIGFEQVKNGTATGIIEIVAGGRRLEAIGVNIASGDLPSDYQIHYLLVSESEAIAISLAENLGREPMHPADMFEAMLELTKRGTSVDDIALAFGVDSLTVKKRLKLANVSPRLFAMYREDQISLDQMVALAITDDHKAQEQAWDGSDKWARQPHQLRRLLTEQQINVKTDRVALYVGVEAFEKAGGVVVRDLFSESGAGYISDAALLETIAAEKLARTAKKLQKEGAAWVDVRVRADRSDLADYAQVRTTRRQPTEAEQVALDAVAKELREVEAQIEKGEEDEDADVDPLYDRQIELEGKQHELLATLDEPHPADKALSGALITIDDRGSMVAYCDVIRPADKAKMEKLAASITKPDGDKPKLKPVHSEKLTRLLTAHRTVALQAEMMNRPDVALVVLTHALVKAEFFAYDYGDDKIAQISVTRPVLSKEVEAGSASTAYQAKREELKSRLPHKNDELSLFAWLLEQPQAAVFELMAFCVSGSLNAVQQREKASPRFIEMAQAVSLNMCDWWKPTAADYFSHVSKSRITDVITQAISAEAAVPVDKLKKAAAAEAAERSVVTTTWLPEVLRTA